MRGGKRLGAGAPKGNQNARKHRHYLKRNNLVCQVCGHRWTARRNISPQQCPNCRSIYWGTMKLGENEFTLSID